MKGVLPSRVHPKLSPGASLSFWHLRRCLRALPNALVTQPLPLRCCMWPELTIHLPALPLNLVQGAAAAQRQRGAAPPLQRAGRHPAA